MSRIAFRVDSSALIGSGHVARCLVLADGLRKQGADVRFLCRALPGDLVHHIAARGFSVETLSVDPDLSLSRARTRIDAEEAGWQEDLAATQTALTALDDVDWLVVDHYGLDADWERSLRGSVRRLMVIDDLANRPHDCDLLLDHNCGAELGSRYDGLVSIACHRLLGPKYALVPPEFNSAPGRQRHRSGIVQQVLVSFGGADVSDETSKAIRALTSIARPDLNVTVAVGASNARCEQISQLCLAHSNIQCRSNPSNMAELFAAADLAIGGGGVTLLERCLFSLPAILESLAPNQKSGCRALALRGGALYLGDAAQTAAENIAIAVQTALGSPDLVQHLSSQAGTIVDGRGVERVVREMFAIPIMVRPAEAADCETIWNWRNHPLTRRFARDPCEIALNAHREWFATVIHDTNRHLLVGQDDWGKVGVVRYDLTGDIATVSVFLDPSRHGQGLGSRLIVAGDAWIRAMRPSVRKVIAEVNSENAASMRAFIGAGYVTEWHRLVHELGRVDQ